MITNSYLPFFNQRKVILCFIFFLFSSLAFAQWLHDDYFKYDTQLIELKTTSVTASCTNLDVGNKNIKIYLKGKKYVNIIGIHQQKSTFKIYNNQGVEVFTLNFTGAGINEIKLPRLRTGIYIVRLETKSRKTNIKINASLLII